MTDLEQAQLRLGCLRLAIPMAGNNKTADIAKTAAELYAFVAPKVSELSETKGRRTKDKAPFG